MPSVNGCMSSSWARDPGTRRPIASDIFLWHVAAVRHLFLQQLHECAVGDVGRPRRSSIAKCVGRGSVNGNRLFSQRRSCRWTDVRSDIEGSTLSLLWFLSGPRLHPERSSLHIHVCWPPGDTCVCRCYRLRFTLASIHT